MSQSVSNSRARGWTAEESLMKTFPLDLTALKKVSKRLGNSAFPLKTKRGPISLHAHHESKFLLWVTFKNLFKPVHWGAVQQNWSIVSPQSDIVGAESPSLGHDTFLHLHKKAVSLETVFLKGNTFCNPGYKCDCKKQLELVPCTWMRLGYSPASSTAFNSSSWLLCSLKTEASRWHSLAWGTSSASCRLVLNWEMRPGYRKRQKNVKSYI